MMAAGDDDGDNDAEDDGDNDGGYDRDDDGIDIRSMFDRDSICSRSISTRLKFDICSIYVRYNHVRGMYSR